MIVPTSSASSSRTASPCSSPGASSSSSSSTSSSPQVFFGRKRSQHELKTLAKLHAGTTAWEILSTPVRKVTKRDSREFHRRKTILLTHPPLEEVKQWEGGIEEKVDVLQRSRSESLALSSGSSSETESEDQSSPRPFSFTFSLDVRRRTSPSSSPASSIASSSSCPHPSDYPEQETGQDVHCDLTFDFDNFNFGSSPRKLRDVQDLPGLRLCLEMTAAEALGEDDDGGADEMDESTAGDTLPVDDEHAVEEVSMLEDEQTATEREEGSKQVLEIHNTDYARTLGEALLEIASGDAVTEGQYFAIENDVQDLKQSRVKQTAEDAPLLETGGGSVLEPETPAPINPIRETTPSPKPIDLQSVQRQSPPSAADLASMAADDNVGLAELAAAVAAINMGRSLSIPTRSPSPAAAPTSPNSEVDSPLPTFRAGPVIIPSCLSNRHAIRDAGPSPFRELPFPTRRLAVDFSPVIEAMPSLLLAGLDSPTPAPASSLSSELLSSPSAMRATPKQQMLVADKGTPQAIQNQPPALVYPPRSKILKSSTIAVVGTPMQRPREKKADPREQAIRGQLNAAVSGPAHRTLGSAVAPMSAARPTPKAVRVMPQVTQSTPLTARTMPRKLVVQATPRSMAPLIPSSIPRPAAQAPMSASRLVLAPRQIQQTSISAPIRSTASSSKPTRSISQLPKPSVAKTILPEAVGIKKAMPAPVNVPVRSMVGVTGRPALALGAPSRLVGSRPVASGGRVMPSPARRGLGLHREPVYSTYKPSSAFTFTASTVAEPVLEISTPPSHQASPVKATAFALTGTTASAPTERPRGSSDDASSMIPECSSSPVQALPVYDEIVALPSTRTAGSSDKDLIKQSRSTRPARAAAQATLEALAPPAKTRRKPAPPIPSAVPNMSEKELITKTKLNTNRNQVYFCAINRIVVRKDGERPPSPTSNIRTVADREKSEKEGGRLERAKRRRRSSEGLSTDEEEREGSRMTGGAHVRGPGEDEDFVTPARPAKRMRVSPDGNAPRPASQSSDEAKSSNAGSKFVTWDKGLVVIRDGRPRSSASGSGSGDKLKSCLSSRGMPTLDQHGNLISTGRPLAEILKRTRIDVTAVFYEGEEPLPVKAAATKKKGKK